MRSENVKGTDRAPVIDTMPHQPTPATTQRPILPCNTKTSILRNSTNMSSIEAALAAIDSLKPGERLNYAQIARQYGVEPRTLARRHQRVSVPRATRDENQRALYLH
jgi:hypothetical protein